MRIDSHQHFWQLARGDYAWLRADDPVLAPLCRDFLPQDLQLLRQAHGVEQTVLVQAADSLPETDFLLDLAARHDFIGGVVGWVDLSSRDAVPRLEGWARHRPFKGVRPMLQDLPQLDWIARAPRPEALRRLERLGLRFDALVRPGHLEALNAFVRAHPDLPVVVDHAAKPCLAQGIDGAWASTWRRQMAELAAHPQVSCKFSGLLTEMAPAAAAGRETARAQLRPIWDALLEWFGPARLMWGSDWPVLRLAGDYAAWVDLCASLAGELSAAEQALFWHGAARRFYGLDRVELP